jgi:hypothetical protein
LDWVKVDRRTWELEEFGEDEEKTSKERDDWRGTVVEGESWRQRRENWRVTKRR